MWKQIIPGFLFTLILTVLTGLVYPFAVTGVSQLLFKDKANGSLLTVNGKVVGSELIGQNFKAAHYFQPRPSSAGSDGYDGGASSGSNLGPTNKKLADRVQTSIDAFKKDNPDYTGPIPADLVTTSGSGLDPHISPASAEAQVARVAKSRTISPEQVHQLVATHTEGRDLGFLGEPRVNVLKLNLDLDRQFPIKR